MKTNYAGIDYAGFTQVNRDKTTGIRYGIIPANDVGQAWYDAGEPDYGDPHCPECGNEAKRGKSKSKKSGNGVMVWSEHPKYRANYKRLRDRGCGDYACDDCKILFDGEDAFGGEPCGITFNEDGYSLNEDSSGDLWVFKSPYFTYAQFCSPCAPGACYLRNPLDEPCESNKCFCLHHDWYENGVAPYPVCSMATGRLIKAEKKNVPCPNCGATGRDSVARIAQVRQCKVEEVDIAQLHVTGYQDNGTFDCWRCGGKGMLEEMTYTEK